jgi:predicted nuclease of predicted toxin-antitoxin system
MRILLDECVPRPFRQHLAGHDVSTVQEFGWAGKKNGELLALMSANKFEVLLTTDRNLRHQQNLANFGIAVVIMLAATNRLVDLIPLVANMERVLASIQVGELAEVRA